MRISWASLGFAPGHDKPLGLVYWTNNDLGGNMWSRFPDSNPGVGLTPLTLSHQIIFNSTGDGIDPSTSYYENSYLSMTSYSSSGSGDWNSSDTWQYGGVPNTGGSVTINDNHTVTLNTDPVIDEITISKIGEVIVPKEHNLEISGNLDVLDDIATFGLLELQSGPDVASGPQKFSSLIVGGTSNGLITYNRWVNADGNTNNSGRDLVSPPVDGQQFNDFYTGNSTSLAAGAGAGDALFGPFDNSTGLYVEYATSETTTLNSGTGYRAGTIGTSGNTLTFTGTVNIGTLEVEITDLGATNYGSWNLIGNPDPCYLSFKDFFDLVSDVQTGPVAGPNNKLDGAYTAVYGYDADDTDPTGKIWTIWDFNNTSYATDLIAPGQGFFVKAKTGAGTTPGDTKVSFLPSMRRTGTSEDFITDNRAADQNLAHIELYLTNSNNSYTTNLYFRDINTRGLDPGYDTGAFRSDTSGIYTNLVEDNAGIALVNQSLPYNDLNNIIVPLGMNAPQGQQHTVSFVANALPQTINVYLEDNVANTWTLLNTGDYVFTPAATVNGSGRFFLHFTTGTLSAEDNELNGLQIYADNISRSIKVKGQLANDTKVSIFDLQGRIVLEQVLNNDVTTNEILVNTLNSGLYIVELQNGRQKLTQKVILE